MPLWHNFEGNMKKQTRHLLMLLLAAFLWGTTFVAQSLGAELVGPFTYLMGRSWIAVVVLLPVIAVRARAAARNGGKPVLPQTRWRAGSVRS